MTDPTALRVGVALGFALLLALGGTVLYLAVSLPRRVMRLVVMEWAATEHARSETSALKGAATTEVATLVAALRTYHDEIGERTRIAREITTAASAEEVASIVRDLRALLTWLIALADELYARTAHVDREAQTRRGSEPPAVAKVTTSGPPASLSTPSGGPRSQTMIGLGLEAPAAAEVEAHGPASAPTQVSPPPVAKSGTGDTPSRIGRSEAR